MQKSAETVIIGQADFGERVIEAGNRSSVHDFVATVSAMHSNNIAFTAKGA
jgi:hypothetical protein